jgi:hypothetical protein
VSYQVLKGGDGSIGMAVRNPKMEVVHPYAWKASSEYEENTAVGGYYSVCLDNQFSRYVKQLTRYSFSCQRYHTNPESFCPKNVPIIFPIVNLFLTSYCSSS